ncbi:MAG TPA: hypothetical protein DCM41_04175 [Synergistaceae bacterium]|nr:hypothetical protein [Synergistaceae bacterium]
MQEKVWVVTHIQGLEVTDANVFNNAADAANYAQEMSAVNDGSYQVTESVLNSREAIEEESARWAVLPEFGADCLECLVQEMSEDAEEEFDEAACAKFFEEKKDKLQKKADEIVHEYLRKELKDYINNERVILG